MKAHTGSKDTDSSTLSLTSALDGGRWSTPRPDRFSSGEDTRYPSYNRLGGTQGRSGRIRKISPPPGVDPRTVQPIAIPVAALVHSMSRESLPPSLDLFLLTPFKAILWRWICMERQCSTDPILIIPSVLGSFPVCRHYACVQCKAVLCAITWSSMCAWTENARLEKSCDGDDDDDDDDNNNNNKRG
jgi:hypothetical protein